MASPEFSFDLDEPTDFDEPKIVLAKPAIPERAPIERPEPEIPSVLPERTTVPEPVTSPFAPVLPREPVPAGK